MNIKDKIYEIRGTYVMLDSDLAEIYKVETKRINEAVKNNPQKFPDRFTFKLSDEESKVFLAENSGQKTENNEISKNLRSKISTSSLDGNYGGRRYGIRVFTEQGVWMLSTILKSKIAINVTINIMDAFVMMRKYISSNLLEQKYINNQVMKNTEDIKLLQDSFSKFESKKRERNIF